MVRMSREDAFLELELEQTEDVDEEAVKRQFKRMALKWHPDKNHGSEEATEKFRLIKDAMTRLVQSESEEDELDTQAGEEFFGTFFAHMFGGFPFDLHPGFGFMRFGGFAGMGGGMRGDHRGHNPYYDQPPPRRNTRQYARQYARAREDSDEWVTDNGSDEDSRPRPPRPPPPPPKPPAELPQVQKFFSQLPRPVLISRTATVLVVSVDRKNEVEKVVSLGEVAFELQYKLLALATRTADEWHTLTSTATVASSFLATPASTFSIQGLISDSKYTLRCRAGAQGSSARVWGAWSINSEYVTLTQDGHQGKRQDTTATSKGTQSSKQQPDAGGKKGKQQQQQQQQVPKAAISSNGGVSAAADKAPEQQTGAKATPPAAQQVPNSQASSSSVPLPPSTPHSKPQPKPTAAGSTSLPKPAPAHSSKSAPSTGAAAQAVAQQPGAKTAASHSVDQPLAAAPATPTAIPPSGTKASPTTHSTASTSGAKLAPKTHVTTQPAATSVGATASESVRPWWAALPGMGNGASVPKFSQPGPHETEAGQGSSAAQLAAKHAPAPQAGKRASEPNGAQTVNSQKQHDHADGVQPLSRWQKKKKSALAKVAEAADVEARAASAKQEREDAAMAAALARDDQAYCTVESDAALAAAMVAQEERAMRWEAEATKKRWQQQRMLEQQQQGKHAAAKASKVVVGDGQDGVPVQQPWEQVPTWQQLQGQQQEGRQQGASPAQEKETRQQHERQHQQHTQGQAQKQVQEKRQQPERQTEQDRAQPTRQYGREPAQQPRQQEQQQQQEQTVSGSSAHSTTHGRTTHNSFSAAVPAQQQQRGSMEARPGSGPAHVSASVVRAQPAAGPVQHAARNGNSRSPGPSSSHVSDAQTAAWEAVAGMGGAAAGSMLRVPPVKGPPRPIPTAHAPPTAHAAHAALPPHLQHLSQTPKTTTPTSPGHSLPAAVKQSLPLYPQSRHVAAGGSVLPAHLQRAFARQAGSPVDNGSSAGPGAARVDPSATAFQNRANGPHPAATLAVQQNDTASAAMAGRSQFSSISALFSSLNFGGPLRPASTASHAPNAVTAGAPTSTAAGQNIPSSFAPAPARLTGDNRPSAASAIAVSDSYKLAGHVDNPAPVTGFASTEPAARDQRAGSTSLGTFGAPSAAAEGTSYTAPATYAPSAAGATSYAPTNPVYGSSFGPPSSGAFPPVNAGYGNSNSSGNSSVPAQLQAQFSGMYAPASAGYGGYPPISGNSLATAQAASQYNGTYTPTNSGYNGGPYPVSTAAGYTPSTFVSSHAPSNPGYATGYSSQYSHGYAPQSAYNSSHTPVNAGPQTDYSAGYGQASTSAGPPMFPEYGGYPLAGTGARYSNGCAPQSAYGSKHTPVNTTAQTANVVGYGYASASAASGPQTITGYGNSYPLASARAHAFTNAGASGPTYAYGSYAPSSSGAYAHTSIGSGSSHPIEGQFSAASGYSSISAQFNSFNAQSGGSGGAGGGAKDTDRSGDAHAR